jgi:RNA methyltransferase, TrmH family
VTITSLHNPRVKAALKLREGRHRRAEQRILIEGVRELSRAITAGVRPIEVFVCDALCGSDDCRQLLATLYGTGAEVFQISEEVFARLAFGHRAEGVLAVAETPQPKLEAIQLGSEPLVAVLEGVEKPGNVGAVLRSADGAGVSALIVARPGTDLYNPNAIRASLGTIFSMPLAVAAAEETLDWLRANHLKILAARVDGAVPYTSVDYRGPTAIVLGSEAAGLSPLWSAADITAVRLPMLGAADSLNVSAAAAVLFYEARRQRGGRA